MHPAIQDAQQILRVEIRSAGIEIALFNLLTKAYAKLLDPETPHEAHDILSPFMDDYAVCDQVCDFIEEAIEDMCAEDEVDCAPIR